MICFRFLVLWVLGWVFGSSPRGWRSWFRCFWVVIVFLCREWSPVRATLSTLLSFLFAIYPPWPWSIVQPCRWISSPLVSVLLYSWVIFFPFRWLLFRGVRSWPVVLWFCCSILGFTVFLTCWDCRVAWLQCSWVLICFRVRLRFRLLRCGSRSRWFFVPASSVSGVAIRWLPRGCGFSFRGIGIWRRVVRSLCFFLWVWGWVFRCRVGLDRWLWSRIRWGCTCFCWINYFFCSCCLCLCCFLILGVRVRCRVGLGLPDA